MLRRTLALAALLATLAAAQASAAMPWCSALPLERSCRAVGIVTPRRTLRLAVAATEPQRAHGLMHVALVEPDQGMLFVFPDGDREREFWMKNTIVPLDMVFVHADGTVGTIATDVPVGPPDATDNQVARRDGVGAYVIELGAGDAARAGIDLGTHLTIPAIPAR